MNCPIALAAKTSPGALAVISGNIEWTYQDLNNYVAIWAHDLKHMFKSTVGSVLIQSHNTPTVLVLYFALLRIGVTPVFLSTRIPFLTMHSLLDKRKIGFYYGIYQDKLKKKDICILEPQFLRGSVVLENDFIAPFQIASVLQTSGTSGEPKWAVHTFLNHSESAKSVQRYLGLMPGDRWHWSLPICHVSGLSILYRTFLIGATLVVPVSKEVIEDIYDYGVTHVSWVPVQLKRMLELENFVPKSLKVVLMGGMRIPTPLVKEALRRRYPLYQCYGLTETSSMVSCGRLSADATVHSGTSLACSDIKVSQNNHIWVRGLNLFLGYQEDVGIITQKTNLDGWFETQDLGFFDDLGRLVISGRADRQFISGGENIQPEEIESVLMEHEAIDIAHVEPKKDLVYGYRPIAFIKWRHLPMGENEMSSFLMERLPKFKHPVAFFSQESDVFKLEV